MIKEATSAALMPYSDNSLHKDLKDRQDFIERNRYWTLSLSIEGQLACVQNDVQQLIQLLLDIGRSRPASDPNTVGLDISQLREAIDDIESLILLADSSSDPS